VPRITSTLFFAFSLLTTRERTEISLDQSSTSNAAVDTPEPRKEEATGQAGVSSHEAYDQWQARRLMFGLALCTAFVAAAIIYEKCG
jgi:hypothetical protein